MHFASVLEKYKHITLQTLVGFGSNVPYSSEHKGRLGAALNARVNSLIGESATLLCILILGGSGMVILPIYDFMHGMKPKIIPLDMPFIESETEIGYWINTMNGCMCLTFALPSMIGIELSMTAMMNACRAAATTVRIYLEDLGDLYEAKEMSETEIKQHFRNILVQFQDIDRWVEWFEFMDSGENEFSFLFFSDSSFTLIIFCTQCWQSNRLFNLYLLPFVCFAFRLALGVAA